MDWKVFWMVYWSIFLAEIGDKTQLGVLSFSATNRSGVVVFTAAALGLVTATLIGVAAGRMLNQYVEPKFLQIGGGALFVAIGIWMIFK